MTATDTTDDLEPAPVEGKVNAQALGNTAGLAVSTLLLWLLGVLVWHAPADAMHAPQAVAAVPAPVIGVLALLPIALGYACGYMAKHTPRPFEAVAGELLTAQGNEDVTQMRAELAQLHGRLFPDDSYPVTPPGARYCRSCGAQIAGPGAWNHADDCPDAYPVAPAQPRQPGDAVVEQFATVGEQGPAEYIDGQPTGRTWQPDGHPPTG